MLSCADARAALLEADLAALDGAAASALAAHLRACPACRAAADRILVVTAALREERARGPLPPLDAAISRARARGAAARRRRRAAWAALPVLAAAGVAGVLLTRPPAGTPLAPAAPVPPPLVESAAGRVAVFTTDNPTIVVVWQF